MAKNSRNKKNRLEQKLIQAQQHLANDQPQAAQAIYSSILDKHPDHQETLFLLGSLYRQAGRNDLAAPLLARLLEQEPQNIIYLHELGIILNKLKQPLRAIELIQQALKIEPSYIAAHINLGLVLKEQQQLEQACHCFNKALELDPTRDSALLYLALAQIDLGLIEEAKLALRRVVTLSPDSSVAHRQLAMLSKPNAYNDEIAAMETAHLRASNANDRSLLAFGLGKAFDDIQQYEKAFEFFLEGNKLKRQTFQHNAQERSEFFQRIENVFGEELLKQISDAGVEDNNPIFILGMPRSGTSLIEQILSSHSKVHGAGELPFLNKLCTTLASAGNKPFPENFVDQPQSTLKNIGEQYINAIGSLSQDTHFVTDKMPHNFRFVGLISAILPNARIIHCRRDPMDTCFSIFKNNFGGLHAYSYDLEELGIYYRSYLQLMNHWERILPGKIYNIDYETVIADSETEIRKLLDHLQLDFEPACLSFHETKRVVTTVSAPQVRQPVYKHSIEKWKQYESQLEPLRNKLFS